MALNAFLTRSRCSSPATLLYASSLPNSLLVECSSDIIDQLGGWSLKSIGEGYGRGYDLDVLHKWISKI